MNSLIMVDVLCVGIHSILMQSLIQSQTNKKERRHTKLVTQLAQHLFMIGGQTWRLKSSKYEYNIIIHPHKVKQEPSLDCRMATNSHPHTQVFLVAHSKSQSKVSYIDVFTSQIQHLPLLESQWLLSWTSFKLRCFNSYYNRSCDTTLLMNLTGSQLPLKCDLQISPTLMVVSKFELMQSNPPDIDLPATSSALYTSSTLPSQGSHPIWFTSIIPKKVFKESSNDLQIFQ